MPFDVEQLFNFCGILVAIVSGRCSTPEMPGCHFVLEQNGFVTSADREVWAQLRSEGRCTASSRRRESPGAGLDGSAHAEHDVSCIVALVGEGIEAIDQREPIWLSVRDGDHVGQAQSVVVTTLDLTRLDKVCFIDALCQIARACGLDDVADVLSVTLKFKPLSESSRLHLERGVYGSAGLVLNGWTLGPLVGKLHIAASDLSLWIPPTSIASHLVDDTTDSRLENSDSGGKMKRQLTAVASVADFRTQRRFYLVEIDHSRSSATFYGPFEIECPENQDLAVDLVEQAFGPIEAIPRDLIQNFYKPVLALPKRPPHARRYDFGPPVADDVPCLSSIIIPFYGDAFFINCVFHLQRVLEPGFELVLVVDDPRIWPEIYARLNARRHAIAVPTILLQNGANYGFATANNLAFKVARGDIVFLMNSDIMVTDPTGLCDAADAIRNRRRCGDRELIAGFSLQYEDNSIQHIGMEFPRSAFMQDMYIADHPMKGLPSALYAGETRRPVPAVTGALMGMSAELFTRLGGFDTVYERGDFEDADLCMRARQLGAAVEVFIRQGLHHLERQSIPVMGTRRIREMITFMNCVEFNARWEDQLSLSGGSETNQSHSRDKMRTAIKVRKRTAV